jgi:hypothetical protein
MRAHYLALAVTLAGAAGCGQRTDDAPSGDSAVAESSAATFSPMVMDPAQGAPNTLTDADRAAGWRLLFDGTSLAGWRGYGKPAMPDSGWAVEEGAITRVGRGGDIVTAEKFRDFELALEWKVAPGGNSGIFYRAIEDSNAIYVSAPEYQVLDDAAHVDGKNPLTSAGAAYGLYAAPRGVVRPAGEWNQARIIARGNRVEHWLNGHRVVEYELQGADWKAKVAASKFNDWKTYGTAAEGHLGLQDHGDRVQFRSIKVRAL